MRTVFADTFYYIALLSQADETNARAVEFTKEFEGRMLTTAWVLTELADGMADPETRQQFIEFLESLRSDPQVTIIPPDEILFERGIKLYEARSDKEWSLTDCVSFIVMQQQAITEALTGDHHFEQAGFVALLK